MLLRSGPHPAGPRKGEPMATDYLLLYSGGSMPESDEEQATA